MPLVDSFSSIFRRLSQHVVGQCASGITSEEKTPLFNLLDHMIQTEGPMTIEKYMETVLHHPLYGYYRTGNPIGTDGDFGTGPEISQLFGEMLGVWCVRTWQSMGAPNPFILLELGPGRGTMMRSLLSGTEGLRAFHDALRLHLVESSTTLRYLQRDSLSAFHPMYIDDLSELPPLPMIVVANEFFDTFPLRQFVKRKDGWHERLVSMKEGVLCLIDSAELASPIGLTGDEHPEGWFHEVSPLSLATIEKITRHIKQHKGAAALIDYGYTEASGENTLFALRRQHFPSILSEPGKTDVTADVDFSAFAKEAEKNGISAKGPIGQGRFFQTLGIHARADMLRAGSPDHASQIDEEVHRLTDASVMGTWFKVLALADKETIATLPGF